MPTHFFADFELDMSLYELRRESEPIVIGARAFDVLAYLIQHRDRLVSKVELIRQVWGVTAMSESSVPTCIAALRKALGDDSTNPRFIETRRGRGYRFIAEVHQCAEAVQLFPHLAHQAGVPMLQRMRVASQSGLGFRPALATGVRLTRD